MLPVAIVAAAAAAVACARDGAGRVAASVVCDAHGGAAGDS